MQRVKKNDMVKIISGYFRDPNGQQITSGKVLRVFPKTDMVLVEGVNLKYKHQKPTKLNPQGGRIRKEAPIPLCKVMPINPLTGQGARIRVERTTDANGKVTVVRKAIGRVLRDDKGKALRNSDGTLKRGEATVLDQR